MLMYCYNHDATTSNKARGSRLCVYINTNWCMDAVLIFEEFMTVICRPFIY